MAKDGPIPPHRQRLQEALRELDRTEREAARKEREARERKTGKK